MKLPGSKPPQQPTASAADSGAAVHASFRRNGVRSSRRYTIAIVLLLVVAFALSLSVGVDSVQLYSPAEVASCLVLWVRYLVAQVAGGPLSLYSMGQMMELQPHFYQVGARFLVSCIAMVCGALFAISGSLYQSTFKNPIAAPTMLGAATGFQIGVAVLVLVFDVAAYNKIYEYYLYTYVAAFAVVGFVILFSRVTSAGKGIDTINLLLEGAIVSQLLAAILTYVCNSTMTDEAWLAYTEISEVLEVDVSMVSIISLALVTAVAIVPVVVMRYAMNSLTLDDDESRSLGIRPGFLKVVALVFGTLMIVTAQVHLGTCAMVALVVPHVCRAVYGFDFSRNLAANAMVGALLTLACRTIVDCIVFVGKGLPLGVVVNLVVLPVFVWMLATQQRTWNDN